MTTEQALDQALTLLFGAYGLTWEDALRVRQELPDSQVITGRATVGDLRRLSEPLRIAAADTADEQRHETIVANLNAWVTGR